MDTDGLKNVVSEKFKSLPERLRGVLESDHISTVIDDLGSKYKLDTNLVTRLDNCTTFVILGLTNPKDFIRSVSETLNLDAEKSALIANEINERVFRPVREDLLALYNLSEQKKTLVPPPAPPKPKPLDAELSENVGLRMPPPPPQAPHPRSLDAELSENLRKPPVPPPARPKPSFVPPPPPQRPSTPPVNAPINPLSRSQPPQNTPSPWQKSSPASPQFRQAPQQPPKPHVFENSFGESREENLSREEILREIENPSGIKTAPAPSLKEPFAQPPKQYNTDPYREPLR